MLPAIILLAVGGSLIYGAAKNVHPWCPWVEAFGGECDPPPGSDSPEYEKVGDALRAGAAIGGTATDTSGGSTTAAGRGYDTGCMTCGIAKVQSAVRQKFGSTVHSLGVCRDCNHGVDQCLNPGTPGCSYSQHNYCNAWDISGSHATLNRVAAFLNANRGTLRIVHVLWQVPYHYDHVHVDVAPQSPGSPCHPICCKSRSGGGSGGGAGGGAGGGGGGGGGGSTPPPPRPKRPRAAPHGRRSHAGGRVRRGR